VLSDRFSRTTADLRVVQQRFDRSDSRSTQDDRQYFRQLTRRINLLGGLSEALQRIAPATPLPLYPESHARADPLSAQLQLLETALTAMHRLIMPQDQTAEAIELGCYPDLPLSSVGFISHMHAAYRVGLAQRQPRPLRFLDVGCGGGLKVMMAAGLFSEAAGFDYDRNYVQAAQDGFARMAAHRCSAFWANALEYEGYDGFDVIYLYKPMGDDVALAQMEDRIIARSRPGTIVVAPYYEFFQRNEGRNCHRVKGAVFVTGLTAEAAESLQAEAVLTGPDVCPPDSAPYSGRVPWMRELFLACAANGQVPG
jgi:SAM-dependent methyltransferase